MTNKSNRVRVEWVRSRDTTSVWQFITMLLVLIAIIIIVVLSAS